MTTVRHPRCYRRRKNRCSPPCWDAGRDAASQLWFNLLWLSDNAALRHFITESDAAVIAECLPVCPTAAPAFLVSYGGFFVDAFPAPLPIVGYPSSSIPAALLARLRALLTRYAR